MKIKNLGYDFVFLRTLGDGSCFLHAVLGCFCREYILADVEKRITIVKNLRYDLSEILDKKINSESTIYEQLSRGKLKELSETFNALKLENMKKFLKSNQWFNSLFLELISNIFNINIYIIDSRTKDLYRLGDNELHYKKRNSIFINYIDQQHFETAGVVTDIGIRTFFDENSEIIESVKKIY